MSNINQNNFDNCFKMRLSNSDYWDLFICNDCGDGLNHAHIIETCLIIDIDVNNNDSLSGNSLCSLVDWSGATVYGTGVTLNDIGLTAIDNGFITYDCTASTNSDIFINTYTGSSLTLRSGDTKFCFTRVTGCFFSYLIFS